MKRHVGIVMGLLITEAGLAQTANYADPDDDSSKCPTTGRSGDTRPPPSPMDEPLVTDRPDFTESTKAVPAGHFQLEAGYTFTLDREDQSRVRAHTAPELLLRVGVVEDFELRFGWDGMVIHGRTHNSKVAPGVGGASSEMTGTKVPTTCRSGSSTNSSSRTG